MQTLNTKVKKKSHRQMTWINRKKVNIQSTIIYSYAKGEDDF